MRKLTSRSRQSQVEMMRSIAAQKVEVPASVRLRDDRDRQFFQRVVEARARGEWTEVELVQAANLARCLADTERLSQEIEREGDIIANHNGDAVINPKHKLIDALARRAVVLTRLLHIHADAKFGAARFTWKQEATARQLKKAIEKSRDDDDLIPLPSEMQ